MKKLDAEPDELRFGIRDEDGNRAARWKLWTRRRRGKSDAYLVCRRLGGFLKVSFHESGRWHTAYTLEAFDRYVRESAVGEPHRFIEKWTRPGDISPGVTLAFRIVTPWSAVNIPAAGEEPPSVGLSNAPEHHATEIYLLFVTPDVRISRWPGAHSLGTRLVGSMVLANATTIWVVCKVIPMPDISRGLPTQTIYPKYYKGATDADVKGTGLRALFYGTEPDGSRAFYDLAAART